MDLGLEDPLAQALEPFHVPFRVDRGDHVGTRLPEPPPPEPQQEAYALDQPPLVASFLPTLLPSLLPSGLLQSLLPSGLRPSLRIF